MSKLADHLRFVGLAAGDTVLVHSQVEQVDLRATLDAFNEVLTADGTLVVPTFNYGFCQGKPYDHDKTPSEVGLFTEYIRRRPDVVRSLHPIYSFAAIGPQAHELLDNVSHSSFGRGSVFERLLKADAKILFLNCSFERCTFVHYSEQLVNVPYRFLKYLTGQVTANGQTYTDTYDMFCRYLDRGVETYLTRLGERLDKVGKMRWYLIDASNYLYAVTCRDVHREALKGLNQELSWLLQMPFDKHRKPLAVG